MPNKVSRAAQEIIQAYVTVRQVAGEGTMVQRVAKHLGRKLDENKGHSQIRRVITEYKKTEIRQFGC